MERAEWECFPVVRFSSEPDMTIVEMLHRTAVQYPEHEAVVHGSERVTYRTVYTQACQMATGLVQLGLQPGERVALLMKNSPAYVSAYFGVLGAGGVVVAMNPDTTPHELQHRLVDSGVKGVICQTSVLPHLRSLLPQLPELSFIVLDGPDETAARSMPVHVDTMPGVLHRMPDSVSCPWRGQPTELAQIIYTSGTTGKPKGIMLSHRNLLVNTHAIVTYLKLTAQDRVLVILPFFYSYGNSLLLTHSYVGGTLVISDNFVYLNKVVGLMVREQVTGFSGVPSSYAMLLRQSVFPKTRFEALRYVTCAGGALAKVFIEELQVCLPQVEIYIMYGQTEASARLSYLPPGDLPRKTGSIGKGLPGVVLQVLNADGQQVAPGEVGEIVAEGDNIMLGYWQNPAETHKVLRQGRLYTGDLATVDEEGFIYIVGRQSDTIKSGAYRLHPGEIEDILNAHPDVVESAVVGHDDLVLGEAVVAAVVLRPGNALRAPDLLQFARKFLPSYKLPKQIKFVEQLPKTASGKIRRRVLREHWEDLA